MRPVCSALGGSTSPEVAAPWLRRGLGAVAILALLASCRPSSLEGSAGSPPPPPETVLPSPRRPSRHFYFGSAAKDGCMVYAVEGAAITPIEATACPVDWQPTERIRIAGPTCFRETPGRAERPVVCPFPLLVAETEDFARR